MIVDLIPAVSGELAGADLGLLGLKMTPPDAGARAERFAELWAKIEAVARQVEPVGMSTISDERALATWQAGIDRAAAVLVQLAKLRADEVDRVALVRSAITAFMVAFAAPLGGDLRQLQAAAWRGDPIDKKLEALLREDGIAAMLRAAAVVAEREVTTSHQIG